MSEYDDLRVRVNQYLEELVEVSRKHGFSLSSEDSHARFLVQSFSEGQSELLLDADIEDDLKWPYMTTAEKIEVIGSGMSSSELKVVISLPWEAMERIEIRERHFRAQQTPEREHGDPDSRER